MFVATKQHIRMEDPLIFSLYLLASLALTAVITYFIVDYALMNHTSVYVQ